MSIDASFFKDFFYDYIKVIEENKNYLCKLDRKIGDGDHGVTMSIGWRAVRKELDGALQQEKDPVKLNVAVGKTFLNAVGSSVGPLYATGFLRGAKALRGADEISENALVEYWDAFCSGVKERGGAEVGDKTMVDTLEPARISLVKQFEKTGDIENAFSLAVKEAEKGMKSTINLLSQKGRSSRLGERSIGNQDPGATSAYLLLETFWNTLKRNN